MLTPFISRTPEKIYVGQTPTDPKAYTRRYLLIEGVAAQSFARNRRHMSCINSEKGRRDPFKITPLLEALYWRYIEDHEKITAEKLEILLNTKEHSPSFRENISRNQTLSPVQLLTLLQGAITKEEPIIQFDYMGMHTKCIDMLRRIDEALREPYTCFLDQRMSRKARERSALDRNNSLHGLPTFLFMFYESGDFPIWLSTAHEVMQEFIEEEEAVRKKEKDEAAAIDEGAVKCLPKFSAATLWGILEPGHPTINGECIHFGICKRQVPSYWPSAEESPIEEPIEEEPVE